MRASRPAPTEYVDSVCPRKQNRRYKCGRAGREARTTSFFVEFFICWCELDCEEVTRLFCLLEIWSDMGNRVAKHADFVGESLGLVTVLLVRIPLVQRSLETHFARYTLNEYGDAFCAR